MRGLKRPLWIVAPLLGVTLLAGCGSGGSAASAGSGNSTVDASAAAVSNAAAGGALTPTGPVLPRSLPVSLRIPAIDVQSTVVQLGTNPDHTIQVPPLDQVMQAGWYKNSPTPGEMGPAVIVGHVDSHVQEGVFFRLHELKAGDQILVSRQDGSTATFVVTKTVEDPKSQFPTDQVYGDTTDSELRLITCGGQFDKTTKSYLSNIIVFATLK